MIHVRHIAQAAAVEPTDTPPPASEATPSPFDVNPELDSDQRALVQRMLQSTVHAFASNPAGPPKPAPGVTHAIHLTDSAPIKQAGYRQSPQKTAVTSAAIAKLLEQDLIMPSNSPWSSPVVLVPKPHGPAGAYRMCIDYRRVNARTRKDAYPIPLIEDCLNMCRGARWLTLIDIKDAYHHIRMDPASGAITAFVGPGGLYEWKVMPFGLCNAPATFQRYVDHQLREFVGKFCAAFFDDCLVYSSGTLEDHVSKVQQVLAKLAAAGLEANMAKCKFAYTELLFVGHVVSQGTIKPDPTKLDAVRKWPTPTNVTGVKSFLGFTNYYHKFIQGYAMKAKALYALTRKGVPFEWSQAAQASFVELQDALCSAPCLRAPDFSLPFILQTDASKDGISGILSQLVEGEEHPVAFISRQLNKAEHNYAATEWECLAVVWAVGQFETYLLDMPFVVQTDHAALAWLQSKRFENSRLMRWALKLQEFKYTIEYRPGARNANADGPSRCPVENSAPPEPTAHDDPSAAGLTAGSRAPRFVRHVGTAAPRSIVKVRRRTAHTPPAAAAAAAADASAAEPVAERELAAPDGYYDYTIADQARLSQLVHAQRNDSEWRGLIAYMEKHEISPHLSTAAQRQLISSAANFSLLPVTGTDHPALFYTPQRPRSVLVSTEDGDPLLAVPAGEWRDELMRLHHDSVFGGHLGVRRTHRKLAARYWWPTMMADCELHVRACQTCQTEKVRRQEVEALAGEPPPPTRPFELLSMDFIGPLALSEDCRYILVIIDHFSCWAIAIPMQRTDAASTARALMEEVFCRYGVPTRILCDNGQPFRSDFLRQLHVATRIQQLFTTTYHPQGNGRVERLNGTIKQILAALTAEHGDQWIQVLAAAVFAYNTSVSEATQRTPYGVLYGREAITPGDALAITAEQDAGSERREGYIETLRQTTLNARQFVSSVLAHRTQERLSRNEQIPKLGAYEVGDLVYCANERTTRTGTLRGHVRPFTGPFEITERVNETTYAIQPADGRRPSRARRENVHVGRLKPWIATPAATIAAAANSSAAAGDEAYTPEQPPAGGSAAPHTAGPISIPSQQIRSFLGAINADEHHELRTDSSFRRAAEQVAVSSAAAAPMDTSDDGPAEAQPARGSAASAAIERHRRSEQPDYSEARHTPEEPRPSHRYSLAPRESHPVTPTSVKKSPS